MSKLEELIERLCPDGVEYKRLEECCSLQKGKTPIQKAVPGEYPLVVTTSERKTSVDYQFDKPAVCIPLVSSRGHGVASLNEVFYQEGKFALGNILCGVTPLNEEYICAKFLYYYLNDKKDILIVPLMKGGANVSLTVDTLKRVRVPVPPIELQKIIVNFLDCFVEYGIELAAELAARQKQYEFYRDELLTFKNIDDTILNKRTNELELSGVVRWMALREICDYVDYRGKTPKKVDKGVFLVTAKNVRYGYIDYEKSQEYISSADYDEVMRRGKPAIGDILITTEAPCGNVALVDREDIALAQRIIKYRPKNNIVLSGFLKHYLLGKEFQDMLTKNATGGTVKGIKGSKLHLLKIPVPPLSEQQRIVDILDRFDALCNDITSGLPAEIEARKKQYEYYRDKLLTFKELKKEA